MGRACRVKLAAELQATHDIVSKHTEEHYGWKCSGMHNQCGEAERKTQYLMRGCLQGRSNQNQSVGLNTAEYAIRDYDEENEKCH